ncbi:MAG: DUF3006 domain-containing protein [Firmicutes bacterium]|jgi:hypothetical protein|nr:DUF3006 domain-containing protein [Bacillota bacterium]
MKYAVDKIEENIVTLESLDTKEKKEVLLEVLPSNIKEGTILTYENEVYKKDEVLEQQRKTSIQNKFNMLRKKKTDNN